MSRLRSRLRLKQIDNKIQFEKSKNYGQVRGSVHEYFCIPHSTYLTCGEDLKSKLSRLYFDVVVFGEETLALVPLIFLL